MPGEVVIIRTSLDIKDPTFVFANPETNILNIVKERFEKKCYKYPTGSGSANEGTSLYVDKVMKIVSHTEGINDNNGSSILCRINNIEFMVSAIRCTPGEILNGCNVTQVHPSYITLVRQPCIHIIIPNNDDIKVVGEGKYMSVLVDRVVHKYGKSIIAISGKPMLGFIKTPAFRINKDHMPESAFSFLRNIFAPKFKDEDEEMVALNGDKDSSDRRARLRDYLYGCKDVSRRNEIPPGCSVISVRDLMDSSKIKSGWYFRCVIRDMDSEDVFFTEDEKNIPKDITRETRISGQDALSTLMRNYYQGMVMLREWTVIYGGETEKTHGNLWKVFAKNKIS